MARRLYRRSRHLVMYWHAGGGVLYNYATAMQAAASPLVWRVVDFCGQPRSVSDVGRHLGGAVDARRVQQLLDALVAATFLLGPGQRRDSRERAMDAWDAWNPSAGFFHTASRQCVIGEQAWFDRRLADKVAERPMPPSVKPPALTRIALPQGPGTPVTRTVMDRRTYRQFGDAPIALEQFAELLRATSGITHWLSVPGLGEVPLKGTPSGGSRHPIETYVVVANVRGLRGGTYRYAADRHELDLVDRRSTRAKLTGFFPQQPWFAQCAAALFFTAVFERTSWRYEFPRAYRAVLLEAGHVCQTFLLTATSLGLAPFCTMAMDDAKVESHLNINGIDEAVIYAAGVGTRPPLDVRAVPPPGRLPGRVRVNDLCASPTSD
jgi:SagB-type dehydrogenase family enzyme